MNEHLAALLTENMESRCLMLHNLLSHTYSQKSASHLFTTFI